MTNPRQQDPAISFRTAPLAAPASPIQHRTWSQQPPQADPAAIGWLPALTVSPGRISMLRGKP
jgi:hypothetical protein